MNNLISEQSIYGLGLGILLTIFFQVIAKLIFDDPVCNKNRWQSFSSDNTEYNRCKPINEKSRMKRIVFLMGIIIAMMIGYHYMYNYRSIQMSLGLSSIFLLLCTIVFEWRENTNKMNALLTGIGIVILGGFSIKKIN